MKSAFFITTLLLIQGCAPAKVTGDQVAGVIRPCFAASTDFSHLVELSMAGAIDPTRASNARYIAQVCGNAVAELKRVKAPDSCIGAPEFFEVTAWKLRASLAQGKAITAEELSSSSLLPDSGDNCAKEAHFPEWKLTRDTPPSPAEAKAMVLDKADEDREKKEAEIAEKASLEAEAAANAATKAADEVIRAAPQTR